MKKTILLVPGFVADTYSEIEASFVELCAEPDDSVQFLWLVPDVAFKYTRFAKKESRAQLTVPLYVSHLREKKIPYVVGNIYKFNFFLNFLLFLRVFRDYRIEAVYAHFGFERFWAILFGKLWGKITIWNAHWHSLGTKYTFPKRVFYVLFVDYFISVSQFVARTLPRRDRIYTVPNSIRTDRSRDILSEQKKTLLRKKLGVQKAGPIILMVAAFTRQKRHMLALSICESVIDKQKDVVFVFLGDGPERERIMHKISERQLEDYFVLPGHIANVAEYYSIADVSMFTGYNDASPYAILEAMKWALPVVAFASGGPVEVIRDNETGILVKEGDVNEFEKQLLNQIGYRDNRIAMGEKAYHIVKQEYGRKAWEGRIMGALRNIVDIEL